MRTQKGHVDHRLKLLAMVMAVHADGDTGRNIKVGQRRLAREVCVDERTIRDLLERGRELGLWWAEDEASDWMTTVWALAVDDDAVIERLEKAEQERAEHQRTRRSKINARHYEKRKTESTRSEPKTRSTGSYDQVDPVLRPPEPSLKTGSGPDNHPLKTIPSTSPQEDQPQNLPFDADASNGARSGQRRRRHDYTPEFETAWVAYGRKGAKKTAFAEWQRALRRTTIATISTAIPAYVASTPELRYRKDFERWLKGDCWESAVVKPAPSNGHRPFRNEDHDYTNHGRFGDG
ncbi:hypothetical protein [Amycolatopsis sp. GM8]|uniref:hypothetical protein n=1 Tax=Amycolatopsis sp. GM8 TaxID=2896530 RepID=UPI001F2447E7|nr:hypothetical protein [Amycolatopsis sp. GM8]